MKKFLLLFLLLFLVLSCENTNVPFLETGMPSLEQECLPKTAPPVITPDNPKLSTEREPFTLTLCGDVFTGAEFAAAEVSYGKGYGFLQVSPYLRASDLSIVNLETAITERGSTKKRAGYAFRAKASTLSVLIDAGIDAVSIANNHVYDFGDEGLMDTLDALEQAGIPYTGAGINLEDAAKAVFLKTKGYTIGFLAFDQYIPWEAWSATESTPGVATFTREKYAYLLRRVTETAKECDCLVVSLHWGTEYTYKASAWEQEVAHAIIDAGGDVIYGHHPHVLQGIELYKGCPILYSCGNFLFYKKNDDAGQTAFFTLTFDEQGFVKGEFTPVYITRMQSTLLPQNSDRYKAVVRILDTYSKPFGTTIDPNNRLFFIRQA